MSASKLLKIFASAAALSVAAFTLPALAQTAMPMNGAELMKDSKHVVITFQNLTTGQPFSPSIFITHAAKTHVFKLGDKASDLIVPIAEGGNIGSLSGAVAMGLGGDFGAAAATIHTFPGQTRSVEIAVDQAHPLLSAVWMLGNTNDGFSGLDSLDVWALKGPTTIEVRGYDAGSEKNNEKKGFLGAIGGGNERDPENGVITFHTGIRGDADAPKSWNWDVSKPVATITITPVTVKAGT